jgi:ATPase family associated with various cellular activities (AAA)
MRNFVQSNPSPKLSLSFNHNDIVDYQCQIEPAYYFMAINEYLPDVITFNENIKFEDLFQKIIQQYQPHPEYVWKYHHFHKNEGKIRLDIFLVQVRTDLLFYANRDDNEVKILYGNLTDQDIVEALCKLVQDTLQEDMIQAESKIFLLYESRGLYLQDFQVKKYQMDLHENYNDDFAAIHEVIIDRLNSPNDKGIVFLHGVPGTGKTSYIRFLTSLINKKMIYIPPEFAHKIASPDFLPLLIDNPNSVLIIEDAENIIEERESSRNMSVANLLNIADGLLSDCLSIQILCTFNTHISKIDKALLRKGRLIASYEFKPLTIEKAQKLSEKLGFQHRVHHPMTLSDIYNQLEKDYIALDKKKIGF